MSSCPLLSAVNPFVGTGGAAFAYGSLSPAAQLPFGALRLGPDTESSAIDASWRHFSGYHWSDDIVRAFSHTRLMGAGVNDLGSIGIMPFALELEQGFDAWAESTTADDLGVDPLGTGRPVWWSSFSKEDESARPGSYETYLETPAVDVELVALSTMAGLHRYRFRSQEEQARGELLVEKQPAASESSTRPPSLPALAVDVCHQAALAMGALRGDISCLNASLTIGYDGVFEASTRVKGSLSRGFITVYLHGKMSNATANKWLVCSGGGDCNRMGPGATVESTRLLFGIVPVSSQFEVAVGISFINASLAAANLQAAAGASRDATEAAWCETLSVLGEVVPTEDDTVLVEVMASAAYRTYLTPTNYIEAGGVYKGLDDQVYTNTVSEPPSYTDAHFSDLSLWDTHRSQNSWLLLTQEAVALGLLRSLTAMTQQQGAFPRWPLANHEGSCMIGLHGAALLLEALLIGEGNSTWRREALMLAEIVQPTLAAAASDPDMSPNGRPDLEQYLSTGYVSVEAVPKSASYTLTYAFDDWILARVSEELLLDADANADGTPEHVASLNETAVAALARSFNYRTQWSSERQLMCPVSGDTGGLVCPRSETSVLDKDIYTEGDALHWLFFVPHDPPGLVELFPSAADFDERLESMFILSQEFMAKTHQAEGVPNPQYWAGNEHDLLDVWLFNYGADCTKTQYWSRSLTHAHYDLHRAEHEEDDRKLGGGRGIPGNDDYGALSSWLLWASLGVYPKAGSNTFFIGSPRVSDATLDLNRLGSESSTVSGVLASTSTSTLRIIAHNNSAGNVYVESLVVNGVAHESPFLTRSDLAREEGAVLEFFMTDVPSSGLCKAAS